MEIQINFIKKVKAIANTTWFKKGQIFDIIKETHDVYVTIHNGEIYCFNKGMFEEIKEEPKPKFKIGDYTVFEKLNITRYVKIIEIRKKENNFIYNQVGDGYYFCEENLRLPTQEELEKYFR